MKIKHITLTNFRNYEKQSVKLGKGINFIVGQNGEGKTNFLEAIYVLAFSKSYKANDLDLIKYGQEYAKVQALIDTTGDQTRLEMILSPEGKKALSNKAEVKRLSDYIGKLNVISFVPEDLNIIKGSPRERRYFVDLFLGQIDKNYLNTLSQYKYILKQRNELLKKIEFSDEQELLLLDVLTAQLAESADEIMKRRVHFIDNLNTSISLNYFRLTNNHETFQIRYIPSIQGDLESFLKSKYRNDIITKTTNYGPHRDDYEFSLNEYLAKSNASQGEQRLMVLALNMSLSDMIYQIKSERPIFLLDDVFSELDAIKQNKLIEFLMKSKEQVVITTTSIKEISDFILNQSNIYWVKDNVIKEDLQNDRHE